MANRRDFLNAIVAGAASVPALGAMGKSFPADNPKGKSGRTIRVALVQYDAVPEHIDRNIGQVELLAQKAVASGARWVVFHESSLSDYTPRLKELAQEIPEGPATRRLAAVAERLGCYLSFGLSEKRDNRLYIAQVFVGPNHYFYRYRKTWLWRSAPDEGYRNEWIRYDPGTGPEIFEIDGVRATCFICADGEAPRCIDRAGELNPQVVFYPNNRGTLPPFEVFGKRAKAIGAPMLVTNRVGRSWVYDCRGGCVVFGADGAILAKANREGREEILFHNLVV
jgi:predicted amidohydrolase